MSSACPSGLNTGAQAQGKYFGTATSQAGLLNEAYVHILDDTADFGQITPENGMKVVESTSPCCVDMR